MEGLLGTNEFWRNKLKTLPDNDCNKALEPGNYIITAESINKPSGFGLGQLLVFGENIPYQRLGHIAFSNAGKFAFRLTNITSEPISDLNIEWNIR